MTASIEMIPFATYRQRQAINASGLKQILQSPMHYQHALADASEPSAAMRLGILLDLKICDPEDYDRTVFVRPDFLGGRNLPVKVQLQQWRERLPPDAFEIVPKEKEAVEGMYKAVVANDAAMRLLTGATFQASVFWEHDGILCKARPDAIVCPKGSQKRVCVDIKTTRSLDQFAAQSVNLRYDVQAVHYLRALAAANVPADQFSFVAVTNSAPYVCVVYNATPQWLAMGESFWQRAMGIYAQCREQDVWPPPAKEQDLFAPAWAKYADPGFALDGDDDDA